MQKGFWLVYRQDARSTRENHEEDADEGFHAIAVFGEWAGATVEVYSNFFEATLMFLIRLTIR